MRSLAAVILTATLVGCGGNSPMSPVAPTAAPPAEPARVVIISVDGLRPDAITDPGVVAPTMLGLAGRGAFTWGAQTIQPSETLPSHSSMLSGEMPEIHGMTTDESAPTGFIPVPTVFTVAHAAGRRTALVASKSKFTWLHAPGSLDSFQITGRGDAAVADEAVARVRDGFDLVVVHFADVDLAGHARGWMSPAYLEKVSAVDAAIGRIVAAASSQTTFIVTADHGGRGTSHGAAANENRTIPWIIAGPGIAPGALSRPVVTMDTAATALHVLGLNLPVGATGRVVSAAFRTPPASAGQAVVEASGFSKDLALASGDHPAKARDRRLEGRVVERLSRVR
jgi:arylsulfatase A-like enzyme